MLRTLSFLSACLVVGLATGATPVAAQATGEEVCATATVEGGSGEVCARRDGFGVVWTAQVADTAEDGRPASIRLTLDMAEARDPAVEFETGTDGSVRREQGRFAPRLGTAIRALTIETCVDIRFAPDRCLTETVELPQPQPTATAEQLERLDELIFELPIDAFIDIWAEQDREGVDASFDWTSDGCSAGPFRDLFDERLQQACIRHDFAYRNLGQRGLAATDQIRALVDDQLAADIASIDQGRLATGFRDALQRFGGPVFHGEDLGPLWGVPDFIVRRISTPELADDQGRLQP